MVDGLLRGESERIEWKRSDAGNDLFEAVCALANDLSGRGEPGYLVLGVGPKGEVEGFLSNDPQQRDRELQAVASKLHSTKLLPTPSFDLEPVEKDGKQLLVIRVHPSAVPPVIEVNGVAFVRSGTTTYRARAADLQRLRERRPLSSLPFDSRPVRGASLDDLDGAQLRKEHEAARLADPDPDTFPDLEPWLVQRQLGRQLDGAFTPNAAALLVFGRSPQTAFPGARVELVRYQGADVDAPIAFRKSIGGTLGEQLEALRAQFEANVVSRQSVAQGAVLAFAPDYPADALLEFSRNLLQHRAYDALHAPSRIEWFDDRIELSNPGGLYGQASQGEFGTNADYRNPLLTALLVRQGYVQQLGRGVRLARKLLELNGNPPLDPPATNGYVRVVVRRRP